MWDIFVHPNFIASRVAFFKLAKVHSFCCFLLVIRYASLKKKQMLLLHSTVFICRVRHHYRSYVDFVRKQLLCYSRYLVGKKCIIGEALLPYVQFNVIQ